MCLYCGLFGVIPWVCVHWVNVDTVGVVALACHWDYGHVQFKAFASHYRVCLFGFLRSWGSIITLLVGVLLESLLLLPLDFGQFTCQAALMCLQYIANVYSRVVVG